MISEERFQVFVGHLETQVGGTLEKMEDIVGRISKRFGIPEVTLRNTRPLHSKESQALVSLLVRLQSVERTLERVDLELVTVHQKLQNSDGYVRQLEDTIRRRKEAIESLRRKKDLTFEEQKRELFQLLEAGEAAGTIPTQPQPEPHFEPADLKGLLSPTEPPPQELVPPPAPEQKPEPEQQPVAQEAESPEADSSSSSSSSDSEEEEKKKKPAPSVEDLFKAERSKELASLRTNETSEELIARAESLLQRLAENTSSVAGPASASTSNSSSGITGASSTNSTISNPGSSAVDAEESASAIAAPSSGDPKAAGKVLLLSLFAPPPARSPSPCSTSAIDSVSADESAPEDSELPAQSSSEIVATPRSGKEHRRHSKKSGDADKKKKKKKSKDKEKDKAEEKTEEN